MLWSANELHISSCCLQSTTLSQIFSGLQNLNHEMSKQTSQKLSKVKSCCRGNNQTSQKNFHPPCAIMPSNVLDSPMEVKRYKSEIANAQENNRLAMNNQQTA